MGIGERSPKKPKKELVSDHNRDNNNAETDDEDRRLGNLPDKIVHLILSNFSAKDLFRFSLVSTRCSQLVLHVPSLSLDKAKDFGSLSDIHRRQLVRFFDKLLALRYSKGVTTHTFSLNWFVDHSNLFNFEKFYVPRLLFHVQSSGVRCLNIGGYNNEKDKLLRLSCSSSDHYLHLFPFAESYPCKFSTIQELRLSFLEISKWIDIGEHVLGSCTSIKKLELNCVHGLTTISIASASLECFRMRCNHSLDLKELTFKASTERLKAIDIQWFFTNSRGRKLRIEAPNLEDFRWTGYFFTNYTIPKQLMHLKVALLCLYWKKDRYPSKNAAAKIVRQVRRAKVLGLCYYHIHLLKFHDCFSSSRPSSFYEVQDLMLKVKLSTDKVAEEVAFLLRALPRLKKLHLQSYLNKVVDALPRRKPKWDVNYWKSQNLTFVNQLKVARIQFYEGINELEFAKYLLMHCTVLEKMEILYSPPLLDDIRRQIMECKNTHTSLFFLEGIPYDPLGWP